MPKMAILYYSSTGANYQMAQWAEAALKDSGAEVKLLKIPETAPESAISQILLGKNIMKQQRMFQKQRRRI